MAERLTFEGNFCEIARCKETRWGKYCPDGACSQRKVWERLKHYEDSYAVSAVRMPVSGYEGYYEVDRFGRVFGVDRVISVDDNGRKYEKSIAGDQLKQRVKNKG